MTVNTKQKIVDVKMKVIANKLCFIILKIRP